MLVLQKGSTFCGQRVLYNAIIRKLAAPYSVLSLPPRNRNRTSDKNNNQFLLACSNSTKPMSHYRQFSYIESITNLWITVSNSTPVAYFQQGLISFHDLSGMPWWATVVVSTILLRTVITIPLAVYQKKIMVRLELIGEELPAIQKELQREAAIGMHKFNWSKKETARIYSRSVRLLLWQCIYLYTFNCLSHICIAS